jgi:hypothetical protein
VLPKEVESAGCRRSLQHRYAIADCLRYGRSAACEFSDRKLGLKIGVIRWRATVRSHLSKSARSNCYLSPNHRQAEIDERGRQLG